MMRSRCASLVALACLLPGPCLGAGYFNMPTSLRQCVGFGFGPGYHAPMVLGPVWRGSVEAKTVKRVRHPFTPAGHTGFYGPTRLRSQDLGHSGADWGGSVVGQPAPAPSIMQGPPILAPPHTVQGYEVVPAPAAAE